MRKYSEYVNFQGTIPARSRSSMLKRFSHRDAWIRQTVGFWVKGEEGKKPFSGSEGPQIDPEQVYVLCLLGFFLFFLFLFSFFVASRVRVGLTSGRLSIFLGPLSRTETGFLSHISRDLAGHLGGNRKSGAPELTSSRMRPRPLVSLQFRPVIDGASFLRLFELRGRTEKWNNQGILLPTFLSVRLLFPLFLLILS